MSICNLFNLWGSLMHRLRLKVMFTPEWKYEIIRQFWVSTRLPCYQSIINDELGKAVSWWRATLVKVGLHALSCNDRILPFLGRSRRLLYRLDYALKKLHCWCNCFDGWIFHVLPHCTLGRKRERTVFAHGSTLNISARGVRTSFAQCRNQRGTESRQKDFRSVV